MATADPRAQPVCVAALLTGLDLAGRWRRRQAKAAPRARSCTRVAMRRFVRSKMQVPEQIKESGGRCSVCGVFEDRTRRLKVPGDGCSDPAWASRSEP